MRKLIAPSQTQICNFFGVAYKKELKRKKEKGKRIMYRIHSGKKCKKNDI